MREPFWSHTVQMPLSEMIHQLALNSVQVSLPVVRQFVKSVEETALGTKVVKGVRPDQQLVKVVNDQLVELMGGQQEDLNDPKDGPQVQITCLYTPLPSALTQYDEVFWPEALCGFPYDLLITVHRQALTAAK